MGRSDVDACEQSPDAAVREPSGEEVDCRSTPELHESHVTHYTCRLSFRSILKAMAFGKCLRLFKANTGGDAFCCFHWGGKHLVSGKRKHQVGEIPANQISQFSCARTLAKSPQTTYSFEVGTTTQVTYISLTSCLVFARCEVGRVSQWSLTECSEC